MGVGRTACVWCALDECTCAVRVPSLCVGRATLPPANPLVKRVEVLVAALRDAFAKLDEVRVTTLSELHMFAVFARQRS